MLIAAIIAVIFGLVVLVWSADRFVLGAAAVARMLGMSPLLIGMVVIGFGTSAPELAVSSIAALQGTPDLAVGNVYGSNLANIGLILGITAVISPIMVHSRVLQNELPLLIFVSVFAAWLMADSVVTRLDALLMLGVFLGVMGWSIWQAKSTKKDDDDLFRDEVSNELEAHPVSKRMAWVWLVIGLLFLVASSRLLVWGAVHIAQGLGVSDLVIGLTVVAVGTSLPELASAIIAARRNEHDLALGNVLGSNLFNTLAVVGVAGVIHPMTLSPEVFSRDILLTLVLTASLVLICYSFRGRQMGRISRLEGGALIGFYLAYTVDLLRGSF